MGRGSLKALPFVHNPNVMNKSGWCWTGKWGFLTARAFCPFHFPFLRKEQYELTIMLLYYGTRQSVTGEAEAK